MDRSGGEASLQGRTKSVGNYNKSDQMMQEDDSEVDDEEEEMPRVRYRQG